MKEKKSGAAAEAKQIGSRRKQGAWSDAAVRVLNERYVMKDEHGKPTETPDELVWRVAKAVASAEDRWADKSGRTAEEMATAFYKLMSGHTFLPNSPTLMNAGKGNNLQLSACYVVPVEDSLPGIFEGIKNAALIHQSGGGCIAGDAHVFTTFCGVEAIATLYERVRATGKQEEVFSDHATIDVRDVNVQTMALNPDNGSYEPAQVTHLWRYDVPLADQVRVRAANGLEVTTSRWHPFMVFDGTRFVERRADELRVGDLLPTSNASVRQCWPHCEYKEVAGIHLDEEIAWLLGYYLGDGSLGRAEAPESEPRREKLRWRLFDGRPASLEYAANILARRFRVRLHVQQDARGLYSLTTTDAAFIAQFCKLLEVYPGPKGELPFPEMIARSPLTVVGAFLAGLVDSDGPIEANRDRLTFTTQSHHLASKVHTLCSLLGFAPAIRSRAPSGKGRSVVYEVKLAGEAFIADVQGVIGPYINDPLKSSRLAAMQKVHEHTTAPRLPIPFSAIEDMLRSIGITTNTTEMHRQPVCLGETEVWLSRWKEGLGVSTEKLLQVAAALRPLVAAQYQARLEALEHLARGATTVEAIEAPSESKPFYDFTVAGHSTYLAGTNGLTAIHNTGFSFSRLRPQGSKVSTTHGVASGPVSFMRIFDQATEAVRQGGTRRGANMGILRCDHPDILQFIDCKRDGSITNFNISVAITDEFMRALEANDEYDLIAPHTKQVVGRLRAREVMDRIVSAAWATGDPGLVFLDRANRSTANPTPEIELLESTNPCGEQWLGPYDACNLGSINLGLFVKDGKVDYAALDETTRLCTRFLDDVIEINPFPLPQVREKVYANRRIGLGVMGWAEMLFELNIRYDSEEAIKLGDEVMRFIERVSTEESQKLAEERGAFPNFPRSIYKDGPELRNSTRTTVAPTGSISILADCSSGIEPIFALAFQHRVKQPDGSYRVLDFVNPFFERAVEESDLPDKEGILAYVKAHGTMHGHPLATHPALQRFVTAHEIAPDWHIRMQAAFQRGVNNSISKCLAAGTLIPTSRGLMAVEDFSDVEEPDTFVNIAEDGITVGGHRVLSHYYAGEKPATRIRLDNGVELTGSTESHRVSTPDGWKRLAELRVGDLIIGRFAASHAPGGVVLPPGGIYRTNAKPVTFPERMTPQLAQFLGMLASDGHTTVETGAVGLTSADEEVIAEFTALAGDLFGLTPRHTIEARNSNVQYLTLNSRVLCRWIEGLIGKGAYGKHVPAQILSGNAEEKLAFLRGVSLDGYYRPKHGLYIYGGMSRSLAYGVAELCRSFGLPQVRQEQVRVAYSGNVAHKVIVSNELQELVQCIEPHKNGPTHYATYQVLLDHEVVNRTKLPTSHPFYSAFNSIRQRQPQNCDNRTAERIGWSSDTPVFRVTAVEDVGVKSLYDIEVEDAHEYVVNGLVSHNTINLPNSAALEDVEQAYLLAWNLGCLGITIFRDGSKGEQVLNVGVKEGDKTRQVKTAAGETTAPRATAESEPEIETLEAAQRETPARIYGDGGGVTGHIKRRPAVVQGYTRRVRAPEGNVNITLNSDIDGLLEVFINVGNAGSDVAAWAEALGRLISLQLRIASPLSPAERAREIVDQLRGIGGSRAVGFGRDQTRSLPDAVARALELHLEEQPGGHALAAGPQTADPGTSERILESAQEYAASESEANGVANGTGGSLLLPQGASASYRVTGNLCPQCGCNTLVYEEGCKKCYSCGYSEC
ncbi:MAG TPA: adenosylcobalamin-dependent ribonucleoside-diphosphate reductase [Ktedonobacterales bacterium]